MMTGLYDLHTHILPGIDDGARDTETALKMLSMEYEQGVRTVVATPHYIPEGRNAGREKVLEAYERIKALAKEQYPKQELSKVRFFMESQISAQNYMTIKNHTMGRALL